MNKPGFFISFEGVDGSGKSTQVSLLKQNNPNWLFTRNPGGTSLGQKLRAILLDKNHNLAKNTELFLYMADRAQHIQEVIEPALKQGQIVVCDRFTDSTVAYQGYGRGLNLELIKQLNQIATDNLQPDLTIVLDLDPVISMQRLSDRDRIEKEGLTLQQNVRAGLLKLASEEPNRIKIVQVQNSSIEETKSKVEEIIEQALQSRGL